MRLKEDLDKLRKILLEGPKSWGELIESTDWSSSVLKDRLDLFEKRGELETSSGKRKGRRTTLYGLANEDLSEAERRRYVAIEFIESIEEPLSVFEKSKDEKSTVSIFMPPVREKYSDLARAPFEKMMRSHARNWFPLLQKLYPTTTWKPGQKMAIVLTREK